MVCLVWFLFLRFQGDVARPPQPKDDIWDIREVPASSVRRLPEAGCLEMGEDKTEVFFEIGKNVVFPWI